MSNILQQMNVNGVQLMGDKELITDILDTEKQLVSEYASQIKEAACPNLRTVLGQIFQTVSQDQFNTFQQMQQRNWYAVKNAQPQDVQTAKQDAKQMCDQMSQFQA